MMVRDDSFVFEIAGRVAPGIPAYEVKVDETRLPRRTRVSRCEGQRYAKWKRMVVRLVDAGTGTDTDADVGAGTPAMCVTKVKYFVIRHDAKN